MRSSRSFPALVCLLVCSILAAAWLHFFGVYSRPIANAQDHGYPQVKEADAESVDPHAHENHRVLSVPIVGNRAKHAVFYVTAEGHPIAGASLHEGRPRAALILSDEAIAVTDDRGCMEIEIDRDPPIDSLVVACKGFLSVPILQPQAGRYDIQMERGASLRFQCSSETGEPIPDVCIQVSKAVVPRSLDAIRVLPGTDEATMSASGVSDVTGYAHVSGLAGGKYLIHASHAQLVQVAGPTTTIASEGDAQQIIELKFCRPVGLVLEIEGGEILTNDVTGKGLRVTGSTMSLAREFYDRFRGAYSDTRRFVCCVGVPGPDPSVQPSADISIWSTDGHFLSLSRDLLPIGGSFKPEKISLQQASRLPLGYIHVSSADGGSDASELLAEVYFRPLQNASPQIYVPPGGGRIALPCGDYVAKSRHPLIQRILPKGALKVRAGESIDWRVNARDLPRPVSWSARLSDGNTFQRVVLELRDSAGVDLYRATGGGEGVFWLLDGCEYHASLRIGPYRCDQSVWIPKIPNLSPLEFVLTPGK